jgi:hypothetical protein
MNSLRKMIIGCFAFTAFFFASMDAYGVCDENCITSKLQDHATAGRATLKTGPNGTGYYAKGTDFFLGTSASAYVSLGASPTAFDAEIADWAQYGYELVEIYYTGSQNKFGLVFSPGEGYCGCDCVVYVVVSQFVPRNCDTDCDGMSDSWERTTFGTLSRDGLGDADGDGVNDLVEYMAGSESNSRASVPTVGNYYHYDNLGRITNTLITD